MSKAKSFLDYFPLPWIISVAVTVILSWAMINARLNSHELQLNSIESKIDNVSKNGLETKTRLVEIREFLLRKFPSEIAYRPEQQKKENIWN